MTTLPLPRRQRLPRAPIEYVSHPLFIPADAEQRIEALPGSRPSARPLADVPPGLPGYLAALYEHPLLSSAEEQGLFTRMNYLKYRAEQTRRRLDPQHPDMALIDRIEADLAAATEIRNRIVQSNLRLIVALAKKLATSRAQFHELVSEGHLPLIRAVELFDVSRGYRFSTYATWAVRNQMLRSRRLANRRREQTGAGDGFLFETLHDPRPPVRESEQRTQQEMTRLKTLLDLLTDRERLILSARYGLDGFGHPHSLSQISDRLGLSKERVRQIALKATEKLQQAAMQISA